MNALPACKEGDLPNDLDREAHADQTHCYTCGKPFDRVKYECPYGEPKVTEPTISKEEFCQRFKARMLERAGEKFDDGESIAEYADDTAPIYWDDPDQRGEGPEECADADMSHWGED